MVGFIIYCAICYLLCILLYHVQKEEDKTISKKEWIFIILAPISVPFFIVLAILLIIFDYD